MYSDQKEFSVLSLPDCGLEADSQFTPLALLLDLHKPQVSFGIG